MNFRDIELLSAYLDGRLNPSEAARLEKRLSSDVSLRASLEDLRQTRGLLRKLPQRRAPRDFRLTPKMAGVRPPEPRSYPAFRFATALAAFLFVAAVALNALTPFAARHLTAAPAPAYGMGGGAGPAESNPQFGKGGGSGQFTEMPPQAVAPAATQAPAPTEAATLQAFTAAMGTPTPEGTTSVAEATSAAAQDAARASASGLAATNQAAPEESQSPIPLPLVVGLGVLMVALGLVAWILRRNNERRIRSQWNQK